MEELLSYIVFGFAKFIGSRIHYLFYKAIGCDKPLRIVSHNSYSIFNTLIGIAVLTCFIGSIFYLIL